MVPVVLKDREDAAPPPALPVPLRLQSPLKVREDCFPYLGLYVEIIMIIAIIY